MKDFRHSKKKPPGPSSRLTPEQELELKQDVLQSPRTLGYEFVNWTGKSAAYHIKIKWGKTLSTRAMIDLFHRLNLTLYVLVMNLQKGILRNRNGPKKAIQQFANRLCPEDHLFFMDEASIKWSATISRMWAESGHQPIVPQIGGHKGVHIIGAVDPKADRGFFAFIPTLKAPQFIEFLESLLRNNPTGKIYIVLDNARVHHANIVKDFVHAHSRLHLIFLPPYSAKLNPIERFWAYLRQKKTHNAYYPKYDEFETEIKQFVEKFESPQQ